MTMSISSRVSPTYTAFGPIVAMPLLAVISNLDGQSHAGPRRCLLGRAYVPSGVRRWCAPYQCHEFVEFDKSSAQMRGTRVQ
jgi:hypothetical protein